MRLYRYDLRGSFNLTTIVVRIDDIPAPVERRDWLSDPVR